MNVRRVTGRERSRLQPWYRTTVGPHRKLDAAEMAQVIHLYLTKQARPDELARRFGVSRRTIFRYLNVHPDSVAVSAAGRRVMHEAQAIGLVVTPGEAERLAVAALAGERAA